MTEKRKAILKNVRNVLKDWDESAHPRDENGRFAGGGGSASGGGEGTSELRDSTLDKWTSYRDSSRKESEYSYYYEKIASKYNSMLSDMKTGTTVSYQDYKGNTASYTKDSNSNWQGKGGEAEGKSVSTEKLAYTLAGEESTPKVSS